MGSEWEVKFTQRGYHEKSSFMAICFTFVFCITHVFVRVHLPGSVPQALDERNRIVLVQYTV
jgi:hypothetical protein